MLFRPLSGDKTTARASSLHICKPNSAMKKFFLFLLVSSLLSVAVGAQTACPNKCGRPCHQAGVSSKSSGKVYLFAGFREPALDGLRLLYSRDGLHWDSIPGIILRPEIGNEVFSTVMPSNGGWNRSFIRTLSCATLPSCKGPMVLSIWCGHLLGRGKRPLAMPLRVISSIGANKGAYL